MTALAERIRHCPRPFDEERAGWLFDDIEKTAVIRPDSMRGLVKGVCGFSPYLGQICVREAEWLASLAETAPEEAMRGILEACEAAEESVDMPALMRSLREGKRRAALLIGLCDVGGVWDLGEVTGALTDLADTSVSAAVEWLLRREVQRGMLELKPENAAQNSGYTVIAMGKHGGRELNYSSDIDLVIFFNQENYPPEQYAHVKDRFIRVTRDLIKVMAEPTGEGYVFRTDLRLRPDPGATPPCMDMDSAERYYESLGKNWERAAYIKARPCAGDMAAGREFLERLQPFVWRRYLDFAAIEDVQSMKNLIHAHKGHGEIAIAGHDIKLGRGGIREIEFFAQTQQLISGGRDPDLRTTTTLETLKVLAAKGWVQEDVAQRLSGIYPKLRQIEHRVQMIDDAHTHRIPASPEGLERLAVALGFENAATFEEDLRPALEYVATQFRQLFETEATLAEQAGGLDASVFAGPDAPEIASPLLEEMGFANPQAAVGILQSWLGGHMNATRSERGRDKLGRLVPIILRRVAEAENPDQALIQFDTFLSGLPSGVQIFSLFEANPHLLDLLTDICAAAPRLSSYLARNARVFEAVLAGGFFEPLPPLPDLISELEAEVQQQADYELVLDAVRRWAKERQFQIGVQILRGLCDPDEAGRGFSAIAEASLRVLEPIVTGEFAKRHGPPPGRGAAVLAMGKLGSQEMTISSDLDLIVIYDPGNVSYSEGAKPLSATQYYARWTQKLVSALTAQTSEGAVYEVDMRLRPSGRAGPLATSLQAFETYQRGEAWAWEHMALTRARAVAGAEALQEDVMELVASILTPARDQEEIQRAALEMRAKLDEAHKDDLDIPWAIKMCRGGLVDIDFIVQTARLISDKAPASGHIFEEIDALNTEGMFSAEEAETMKHALTLQLGVMHVERVALEGLFDPEKASPGLKAAMADFAQVKDFQDLSKALKATQGEVRRIFAEHLKTSR